MKIMIIGALSLVLLLSIAILSNSCRKSSPHDKSSQNNIKDGSIRVNPTSLSVGEKVVLIEHIGEIDKPIPTIILSSNGLAEYKQKNWEVRYGMLTDTELNQICQIFEQGGWFTKTHIETYEFGAFRFTTVDSKIKRSFVASRPKSIIVLEEIKKSLRNNMIVYNMLEETLNRIRN